MSETGRECVVAWILVACLILVGVMAVGRGMSKPSKTVRVGTRREGHWPFRDYEDEQAALKRAAAERAEEAGR